MTTDPHPDPARSRLMSRVRQRDTTPEIVVRRAVHALGYRFRLHRKDLPGTPDLVFPGLRTALFVHGCFWHAHPGCKSATVPKTRTEWWRAKLQGNVARDALAESRLQAMGWQVGVVWGCETRNPALLREKLAAILPPRLDCAPERRDHGDSQPQESGLL